MSAGLVADAGAAREALAQVPPWRGRQPRVLRALGGGPSNNAWLVACDGRDYVLRLDTPLTDSLSLERRGEAAIVDAASAAGIAPAIFFARPERGLQITHFAPGQSWRAADLAQRDNLERLAGVLRELHSLRPDVRHVDLASAVLDYADRLGAVAARDACAPDRSGARRREQECGASVHGDADRAFVPPTAVQAASWARAARHLLNTIEPRALALCHHDLVAANIVDDGDRLWLIDWEYAGLGDPCFDLAIVVRHHNLDATRTRWLLTAYLGAVSDADQARLRSYCRVYDYVLLLWLSVLAQELPLTREQQTLWLTALRRAG